MEVSMPSTTTRTPQDILQDACNLDDGEQISLFNKLSEIIFGGGARMSLTQDIKERRFHRGLNCLYCDCSEVVKNGKHKEAQRYKCKACERTFTDLSATPLSGSRYKDKWPGYLKCMIDGKSIRKCSEILEISVSTSFMWRHKILNAISRLDVAPLKGIAEIDETFMLHSEKGSRNIVGRKPRKRGGKSKKRGISNEQDCILVALDRTGNTLATVACRGRISKKEAEVVLDGLVQGVTTLCTDSHSTWQAFARDREIEHVELNVSKHERVRGLYHIQNVNNFHQRFKGWLDRFRGVASKFMNNYIAWFRFLDAHRRETDQCAREELLVAACMAVSEDTFGSIKQTQFTLPC
jgi:transposase-like protein